MNDSIRDKIINGIIDIEGGYVNDPSDSGGETNFGITKKTALKYGYLGSMEHMSRQTAFDIYAQMYWRDPKFDKIALLSEKIAEELADTGVNMGPGKAVIFLQRALNALNHKLLYQDLKIDGSVGQRTLDALKINLNKTHSEEVILKMLNSLQGAFYIELSEKRKKDRKFIFGWFLNRI